MKIEFKKITPLPKYFSISHEDLKLDGEIKRVGERLFRIDCILSGKIDLICDHSGEEYQEELNEQLVLYVSNGIWDMQSQDNGNDFDVIEFFEGFVDFGYILQSEIDSIQMQYHIKQGD